MKQVASDKIARSPVQFADAPVLRKPSWIRVRIPSGNAVAQAEGQAAREPPASRSARKRRCPNIDECFGNGTATFMILGEVCTRRCSFCDVAPRPAEAARCRRAGEPRAHRSRDMALKYVVITSVDRDDLRDGGAAHFVDCIRAIRREQPGDAHRGADARLPRQGPDGARARDPRRRSAGRDQPQPRDGAAPVSARRARAPTTQWSLTLLRTFKAQHPGRADQVRHDARTRRDDGRDRSKRLRDLRAHDVDMLTIGQYLQPSPHHHPVLRYWTPDEFKALEAFGMRTRFPATSPPARWCVRPTTPTARRWKPALPPERVRHRGLPGLR